MEEVEGFRYLGYTFSRKNDDEAHIREITRKAAGLMAQVWWIGERKFGGDRERRMMLFNVLVKSIFMYGVEIWGWKERKKLEDLQTRYIRWILGLERCTPRYVVRMETKVDKIIIEAGYRALKYQERIRGTENKILRECRKEMEKEEWETTNWGREMKAMLEEGGTNRWEREAEEDKGIDSIGKWRERYAEKKRNEDWASTIESKSAKEYKKWSMEKRPKYLEIKGRKNTVKMIARFRCCNEWKGERYWEEENKKECRVCGEERETWQHIKDWCSTRTEMGERLIDCLGFLFDLGYNPMRPQKEVYMVNTISLLKLSTWIINI